MSDKESKEGTTGETPASQTQEETKEKKETAPAQLHSFNPANVKSNIIPR